MKLSLVVPCHNAEHNSATLFERIRNLNQRHVEAVLVDDGSTDGTLDVLNRLQATATIPVHVIQQVNKGPGGARNTGLRASTGDYVWFIDCDDDITEAAVDEILRLASKKYDFIDFNCQSPEDKPNTMGVPAGVHSNEGEVHDELVNGFGRLWTKIFRREWLNQHLIAYPEHCIYEDNPLAFTLPFVPSQFYKSEVVAYLYTVDNTSVTRAKLNPRVFDRILTGKWGVATALSLAASDRDREALWQKHVSIAVVTTYLVLLRRMYAPNSPIPQLISARRYFRLLAELLVGIQVNPFRLVWANLWLMQDFRIFAKSLERPRGLGSTGARRLPLPLRLGFNTMWAISFAMPANSHYFEKQHMKAWGQPIAFPPAPRI